MNRPWLRLFGGSRRAVIDTIVPQRTFRDVVLPPRTRRALDQALAEVENRALIFDEWGLGERHPTGTALAFNFAGPSGTGKTICAEAIAQVLGKRLLVVRYAELESMWVGETPKNVTAVFRMAEQEDAVLFFDEADAIAARRTMDVSQGHSRESNTVVNVLLQELERFGGVVIFATNLAANFDPAFERRIRTHVLFEMPGRAEREQIWKVQLHPWKTPLDDDVDFAALAERFAVSGGDIRNAVLKAALAAASEPVAEAEKRLRQGHFVEAMEEVIAGRRVMQQSLFDTDEAAAGRLHPAAFTERMETLSDAATRMQRAIPLAVGTGAAALLLALVALLVALLT
jgi:SpoVK/Ycf46/Vps4 family AAA+-type ATPase